MLEIQQSVIEKLQQIHCTLERMDRNFAEHTDILKVMIAARWRAFVYFIRVNTICFLYFGTFSKIFSAMLFRS